MKSAAKPAKRINNYEVYPKAGVAQTIVFQNMSSHYRRIYGAKSRVDTTPPFSHRPVKPVPPNWKKKQNECRLVKPSKPTNVTPNKCSRPGCGEVESSLPTYPTIGSKLKVESKLRNQQRVYHPPRRRAYVSLTSTPPQLQSKPEISVPDIPWITKEVKATPSKGSSSDSAYTEGEEGEGVWSGGESRGPTPVSDSRRNISSENLMYVKFVRGITDEVLRKGVFTNKALNKIFQSHIESHKQFLNLRKMQEEVEKLQLELGIPKEDDLDTKDFSPVYKSSSEESEMLPRCAVEDTELLEALSQLNISPSLKADIANSLGLYSAASYSNSKQASTKRTTFSSPLEVVHDISHKSDNKLPQSDDDSYEMLSEGPESRPLTPLGLAW